MEAVVNIAVEACTRVPRELVRVVARARAFYAKVWHRAPRAFPFLDARCLSFHEEIGKGHEARGNF